jgi:hypothetical protein
MTEQYLIDQPNADESRQLRVDLCELLIEAYPKLDAAGTLIWEMGIDQGDLPQGTQTIRQFWRETISVLARRGQLRALVERAAQDSIAEFYKVGLNELLTRRKPPSVAGGPAEPHAGTRSRLNLRDIRGIPFASLPEGVQRELENFARRRREYEAGQAGQTPPEG